MSLNRREFLKTTSIGAAAFIAGTGMLKKSAVAAAPAPAVSKVAFASGGTCRRQMMLEVLEPLRDDITAGIQGKQIIIKPNCVVTNNPLACTHADAIRGVIDFLRTIDDSAPITIAEISAMNDTARAFMNYGYNDLTMEYDGILLVDGNSQPSFTQPIVELDGNTYIDISVSAAFADPNNYIISLCRPKTHNCVVATLTMKNILMGAPLSNMSPTHKTRMHGSGTGNATTSLADESLAKNLYSLANIFLPVPTPALGILDGYEGMEGDGPSGGTAVDHRIAVASTDPVAVDRIGITLMGIDPEWLPYLKWCGTANLGNYDLNNISIVGPQTDVDEQIIPYRLHRNIETQKEWFIINARNPDFLRPRPFLSLHSSMIWRGGEALIRFRLPMAFLVNLDICSTMGRQLRRITSEYLPSGGYSARWDGRDDHGAVVSAGNYIVKLQAGPRMVCGRLSIVR
jgi:uncharacterized protein (DUF362 family)